MMLMAGAALASGLSRLGSVMRDLGAHIVVLEVGEIAAAIDHGGRLESSGKELV
jgi:hypothetical protein